MTQDFSVTLLKEKVKYYVEKGLKRGLTPPQTELFARKQVNNWLEMYHPEQVEIIGS